MIAFADNYKTGKLFDLPILSAENILDTDFDYIMIASVHAIAIKKQLLELGIDESRIQSMGGGSAEAFAVARVNFCEKFALEVYRKGLDGSVAEAGVYQGDFSAEINRNFYDRKLYLFDTFSGFDGRDIEEEAGYSENADRGDYLKNTSVNFVMSKMKYPENIEIKRGYVPETFAGIDDSFIFVNLDMDLYKPTLEALKWFWPRINKGGVCLIHDYFDDTDTFPNLKKAVSEFIDENDISSMPVGDNLSIALIKR